jgi:phosphoribosylformylglycinamidine synthase
MYQIGEVTDDHHLVFFRKTTGQKPINLPLVYLFGKPPRTVINDETRPLLLWKLIMIVTTCIPMWNRFFSWNLVACKDWLTNKVTAR